MLDLRSNLELLSSSAHCGTDLSKNKFSKFLKNKRIECLNLLKGMVTSCHQNMNVEKDVFVDLKLTSNKFIGFLVEK